MTQWNPDRERTIIDFRKGGPGNPWQLYSDQGEMSAPSGGGQSVESRWGRSGETGASEPKGTIKTSNPERFTLDLSDRLSIEKAKFLRNLRYCNFDVRVRQYCGDIKDIQAYDGMIVYLEGAPTSKTYSGALADNAQTSGTDMMETFNMSAIDEVKMLRLAHLDLTKTAVDAAINRIRSIGKRRCTGDCGTEKTGEEDFIAGTDADATPGYFGEPTGKFGYTENSGNTWTFVFVNVYQNANVTDVLKNGAYILLASPEGGIAYARYQDILDNVDAPFVLAHFDASNNARVLATTPDGTVWAAGNNGYVYRSIDGGFTWSTFDAGVSTTENIISIQAVNDNLIWFGAENGVLLKYSSGSISPVASGVAAHINAVAVPPARSRELYFGTAGGRMYRSTNVNVSSPVFTELALDGAGNGSVDDLQFSGYQGNVLFIVQSNAAGKSRVLRDLSGGAMGLQAEVIASYNNPDNEGINSIAPANENFALTAGELVGGFGFFGKVAAE